MLSEEAVRREDRDLSKTLTEPARLPMLEAVDQDLLTRLRTLARSTAYSSQCGTQWLFRSLRAHGPIPLFRPAGFGLSASRTWPAHTSAALTA